MDIFPSFLFVNLIGYGTEAFQKHLLEKGKLRDQSSTLYSAIPPDFSISYILGKIIAERFNLTLITNDHPIVKNITSQGHKCGNMVMTRFPQIIFPVHVFGGVETSEQILNCFQEPRANSPNVQEKPVFVRKQDILYNFAYCSVPKKEHESTWNFKIFTDLFDVGVLVSLSILLALVSLGVSISTRRSFSTTFLYAFVVLLDNEIRHLKNAKLYILWLFNTFLIVDFYSGAISSQVIAPPKDTQPTKFSQLQENNFSIIFPHKAIHNAFSSSARTMRNFSGTTKSIKILEGLLPGS